MESIRARTLAKARESASGLALGRIWAKAVKETTQANSSAMNFFFMMIVEAIFSQNYKKNKDGTSTACPILGVSAFVLIFFL
ncbi:MAG: hypothetical protein IIT74_05780, partial [Bacteroidales bacterium]|nr:hypothetical protein [Bacteroidales bacterium]